jgi:type IV pilus assembly protein PilY1
MNYFKNALLLLILLPSFVIADDTEIFTGGGTGGNTNLVFLIDTSRSMTAFANDDEEPASRPAYDSSVNYDNTQYEFKADAYYVYDLPNNWDLNALTSLQKTAIKNHEVSFDAINCSLISSITSGLNDYGIVTGTFAFFNPGSGWGTGTTNTNSGSILQCKENEGSYSYGGTTYLNMVNGRGFSELNAPYTNTNAVEEEECSWESVYIGTKWWHVYLDQYYEDQLVCNTVNTNLTYQWTNDSYNRIWSGNYLNYLVAPYEGQTVEKLMRIQVVQQAAKEVLASTSLTNMNIGIMSFSSNGKGGMVRLPTTSIADGLPTINSTIDSLVAYGGTPIEESLYEAYLYMSGKTPLYGNGSTVGKYINNLDFTDDNYRVDDNKTGSDLTFLDDDSAFSEKELSSKSNPLSISDGEYIAPSFNGCEPNSKIILFSDGAPSGDSQKVEIKKLIKKMPLPNKSYLSRECNSKEDLYNPGSPNGQCAEELAYYLANSDHRPDIPGSQTIQVDTMGGFIGADASLQQYLENIAEAGNGTFYPVDDYQSMVDNFRSAITDILEQPSTFTSPAIAVSSYNSLETSDELYYAVFEPTENGAWHGNLKRYKISSKGVVDSDNKYAIDPTNGYFLDGTKSFWSTKPDGAIVTEGGAAARLGDKPRNIYTLIDGSLNKLSTASLTSLTDELLGLDAFNGLSSTIDTASGLTYRARLLNWIQGLNDDGTPRLELEDAIHSRPVVINYSSGKQIVYFGTNSGYLHGFDTEFGQEVFSIIPEELLGNPHFYKSPEYASNSIKIYGIDGPLTYWHDDKNLDGKVDTNEKVYLYVALRRGGHSYYAFDITDPNNPSLKWEKHGPYILSNYNKNVPETVDTGYERLGQTWSSLKPIMIKWNGQNKVVLIAGGGYDPLEDGDSLSGPTSRQVNQLGNTVYIIDPENGNILWDAYEDLPSLQESMTNSIPSDIAPIDRDADGLVDLLYASDVGGRVWRFDLNQKEGTFATGGVIADINNSTDNGIVDNRRFYNRPDISYIKDVKKPFLLVSIGSGYRAHPLSTDISDSLFLIKDNNGLDGAPDEYLKVEKSDLVNWSSNDAVFTDAETGAKDYEIYSPNGWYFDLTYSGEKILGETLTLDGLVTVNSFAPTGDLDASQCTGNAGQSRTYQLLVIPEYLDRYKCEDGGDSCKPSIPGQPPGSAYTHDGFSGTPKTVIPPPCEETDATCIPTALDCEDYQSVIISGTSTMGGNLDRCDLFETNYWEEVQ